ncbi:MAG: ornithine carbamoyltransferase [Nanoarchaeota archaeon]
MKNLISILDLKKKEILQLVKRAKEIKKNPERYKNKLYEEVLLTFFALPSLRTELSFDVAMFKMGGEVIDYHSESSPWAHGKESIEDVSKVVSKYCDIVMIRMSEHEELLKFSENSKIPVINGLTSLEHPCQILSDLLTIYEKKGKLNNLKIAYFGDSNNNVTHSLIYACALLGLDINVCCPSNKEFSPDKNVLKNALKISKKTKSKIMVTNNIQNAAKNADVIYTDTWISYRIPKSQYEKRIKILKKFQVDNKVMNYAKKDAIFMHCLPALRGQEVTAQVLDSKRSVVFDQAGNRLYMQKAILLQLLKR